MAEANIDNREAVENPRGAEVAVKKPGMIEIKRHFTKEGVHPYDEVKWELRKGQIASGQGEVLFEQDNIEMPEFWSQMATNVVSSKYFHGPMNTPERETSLRQLIDRVARTISAWGVKDNVLDKKNAEIFEQELTWIILHQYCTFNSPVWFNCGTVPKPQCSACFINSVEDSMDSILGLARTEGLIFKYGSGTGTNFSPLRSSKEGLSTGGVASGPVSFMKGYDAFAGVIKSGGKTRRSAKMVILNVDHPDIVEFIDCKVNEEKKAWSLIDAGYDGSFRGEAYNSVFFQNSNNSVRVTDEFMRAVEEGGTYTTKAVVDGRVMEELDARAIMSKIAESAHVCGDPGLQFDDTINNWHTCPNTDRIHASNPCSEYMFLNDTACNLASLNIMKFRNDNGTFDYESFIHVSEIFITAMEIIVDNASYPTDPIAENSHLYRPLGLGYANLGAFLMSNGIAYDSEEGRAWAAAITAVLCGAAYRQSARLAGQVGPFPGFEENAEPMRRVIRKHWNAVSGISTRFVPPDLFEAAESIWRDAYELGKEYGFRNAQATVLAPTGTIAFMMDCDTTGVEPDLALVKYKKLADGGLLKIVNHTVPMALDTLGYSERNIQEITDYINTHDTIEGAPGLKDEHLGVFDCAFKPMHGVRSIHHMGHVRMMAAVQPFLSGAISKTINMPSECTAEDIAQAYLESWKLGLKSMAVYRDGSKRLQPLNTGVDKDSRKKEEVAAGPVRKRLPDERAGLTHKFSVGGHEGYLTVGLYEDGSPGELFIVMSKEGSVVSGLMDGFATAVSLALQYGVPLEVLCNKFSHMRFDPSGWTGNKDIPMAKSVLDYIFRWMELRFLGEQKGRAQLQLTFNGDDAEMTPAQSEASQKVLSAAEKVMAEGHKNKGAFISALDSPPCPVCGEMMVRSGTCHKCLNCGQQDGCG